jgi:hypothetical protein
VNQNLKLGAAALGGVVATLAAGGIAFGAMGHGMGPIGNADLNNDGQITRAEWLQKAGTTFDGIDANKDGKLVVGEVPPPPPHHGHGHRPPGPDFDDDWGPDAAPATAPASAAPVNAAAPAAQQAK